MTKRLNSLTVLAIITLVMVLLMMVTIYRAQDTTDDYALLFPGLFEDLNRVDNIAFKSREGSFTLYREGEEWFLREHYGYPANFDDVKRMLIDIAEAKILERKTDNPMEHNLLGVEGGEDSEALQITLLAGEDEVAGLVLGKQRPTTSQVGPKEFYVRRAGEDRAWLTEGYLLISPVMLNWIQGQIMDLARERIARVEIIQPNGDKAELINLGQKDKFGTPESRDNTVFRYAQLGYDIAGSLHALRMEDVLPVDEFSRGDADVVTARFTTFDGLVITSETSFDDGFYYARFSASFEPSVVKAAPDDIQQLDVLKTADEVRAEVEELNSRLAPWVYRVSGFVGTNLMRARSDIVTERDNVIPMPADVTGFGP